MAMVSLAPIGDSSLHARLPVYGLLCNVLLWLAANATNNRTPVQLLPKDLAFWQDGSFRSMEVPPDEWDLFVLTIGPQLANRYLHIEMRYEKARNGSPDPMLLAKKDEPPQAELVQRNWHWNTGYVDTNAYFLWKEYHHLTVPPQSIFQRDSWYIGVYNIRTVKPSYLKYDLRVSVHDRRPCPRSCVGNGYCASGRCICNHGWADNDCSVPVDVLQSGKAVTSSIEAGSMRYHYIDVEDYKEHVLLMHISRVGGDPLVYVKASGLQSFTLPTVQDYTFYYPIRWYGEREQTLSVPISHFAARRWFIGLYNMDHEVVETSVCTVQVTIEDRRAHVESLMISTVVAVATGILFLWVTYALHRYCRARRTGTRQLEIVLQSEGSEQSHQWRLERLELHFPAKSYSDLRGKLPSSLTVEDPDEEAGEFNASSVPIVYEAFTAESRPSSRSPSKSGNSFHPASSSDAPPPTSESSRAAARVGSKSVGSLQTVVPPAPASLCSTDSLETCAICLVEFEPLDMVRSLSCRHVFHRDCIDEWLGGRHSQCPLCKTDFDLLLSDPMDAISSGSAEAGNPRPGEPFRVTVTINPQRRSHRNTPVAWLSPSLGEGDAFGDGANSFRLAPDAWRIGRSAVEPVPVVPSVQADMANRARTSLPNSVWGLRPVWHPAFLRPPRD